MSNKKVVYMELKLTDEGLVAFHDDSGSSLLVSARKSVTKSDLLNVEERNKLYDWIYELRERKDW